MSVKLNGFHHFRKNSSIRIVAFLLSVSGSIMLAGCGHKETPVTVQSSGVEVTSTGPKWDLDDWPMWRGANEDGHVESDALPTEWSENQNILWMADVPGRGHGSPIIIGDLVVMATADVESKEQFVIAYDVKTGKEQWKTVIHQGNFPSQGQLHADSTHANGTLASDGERLFVTFLNDQAVHATAITNAGKIEWQTKIGEFSSLFGYAPSPIIYGSAIIVSGEHLNGAYLAAVDRESGTIAWLTNRSRQASFSTPLVQEISGEDQIVICGGNRVESYDPKTGAELWSASGTSDYTCGTPVTDGTNVYASGGHPRRETVCIKADGTGTVVWRNREKLYEPSLIVANNLLFGLNDEGIAFCWSLEDGSVHWKTRLGGSFSASPIFANGLIYGTNDDGVTFVFEATDEEYRQVAKNELGSDTYASPAVSDDKIFLRAGFTSNRGRQERLVCIANSNTKNDTNAKVEDVSSVE